MGEIEVKSKSLFRGYWRQPGKTKQDFTEDGFFVTGDVGKVDGDGFFTILGRNKDLIITGGLNVYPKEIEDVLDEIEGVSESTVIGIPHSDFGEAVLAVVVPKTKFPLHRENELERAIIEAAKQKLSLYKIPKRIVFMNELPRNSMAKVQKKHLREQFADLFAGGSSK